MREILEDICAGKGTEGDIELLEKIATGGRGTVPCARWAAALPIRFSARLDYFRDEYDAHI